MVDSIFRLFAFQPYHVSQCYRGGGSRKYVRKTQTSVLYDFGKQTAPDFWSLRCGFWPVLGGDFLGEKMSTDVSLFVPMHLSLTSPINLDLPIHIIYICYNC